MVDLIRRRNANVAVEDFGGIGQATANLSNAVGGIVGSVGNKIADMQAKADKEYKNQVQSNIKAGQADLLEKERKAKEAYNEMKRLEEQKQKAFDASDKLIAADRAGQLNNELLRWNMEQRTKNPDYIGTPDHEKAMRDYYNTISGNYSSGLGQAGLGEFNTKTQGTINQMIGNDIKWAYQQKIKKGEESAKGIAKTINDNSTALGANGDVQAFKDSYNEESGKLKDYMDGVAPNGTEPALQELGKKSLVNFYSGMAETDPRKAKMLLENAEQFKETVPESLLENEVNIVNKAKQKNLNDRIDEVNIGLNEAKSNSPLERELKKQKKQLEKEQKQLDASDNTDETSENIRNEVADAVKPIIEKSLGENALLAKERHEEEKVSRFQDFMKLPTPENLKWFEEDNQMSYAKPEKNMTELPVDFFSYGDVSTLKDFYDMFKGRYDESQEKSVLSNANKKDLERIDKLVSGGMSEADAVEKVFNETESEIAKRQKQKQSSELLQNMIKYRENFGNVSMSKISDVRGTKQMFDNLKAIAKTDADNDGRTDNILLKGLTALNDAKNSSISEEDYNNYQNVVNKAMFDSTFKGELNNFMEKTADFMPNNFWNKGSNVAFTSNKERLNEKMESKQRDVLRGVLHAMSKDNVSLLDASKMYREGIQKAYNEVTTDALGVNMSRVVEDYKNNGFALANIKGKDYMYVGTDTNGNPLWKPVYANGMSTQQLTESAKKMSKKD